MSLYRRYVLPRLVHAAMRQEILRDYRRRLLADAAGRVLEIGVGSALNLPFYPPAITRLIGLDPSLELLSRARGGARARVPFPVTLLDGTAEATPLRTDSVDTVVSAWTLCSVADPVRTLQEIRRVLRPGGRLLFVEHGRAPETGVRRWQDRLTPVWKRIAGGCHLNRPVRELVEQSGFRLERLESGYMKGPRPMTFMYEGSAR